MSKETVEIRQLTDKEEIEKALSDMTPQEYEKWIETDPRAEAFCPEKRKNRAMSDHPGEADRIFWQDINGREIYYDDTVEIRQRRGRQRAPVREVQDDRA